MAIFAECTIGTNFILDFINCVASAVNLTMDGAFGIGISLAIFYISFFMFKSFSWERAYITAATITMLLGLFMMVLGWFPFKIFGVEILLLLLGWYSIQKERSNEEP